MKKISLLFAMLTMMVSGAWAESTITLTFSERTKDCAPTSVKVSSDNSDVTASLTAYTKNGSSANLSDATIGNASTADVLDLGQTAPNGTPIGECKLFFTVNGLNGKYVKSISIEYYYTNSSGVRQTRTSSVNGTVDFTYKCTKQSGEDYVAFGSDVTKTGDSEDGSTNKTATFTASSVALESSNTMNFTLSATNTCTKGCYVVFKNIKIVVLENAGTSALVDPTTIPALNDILVLRMYQPSTAEEGANTKDYVYSDTNTAKHDSNGCDDFWVDSDSKLAEMSSDVHKYMWKLEDAGTYNGTQEYYLRNLGTGLYLGKQTSSSSTTSDRVVPVGTERVPYYIEKDKNTSIDANYRFAFSSRLNNSTNTSLNCGANNNVVTYTNVGGRSQSALNKITLPESAQTTYTLKIGGKDGVSVWFDGASYTASTQSVDYYGTYNDCVLVPTEYDGYTTRITKTDNTITVLYIPSTITRTTAKDSYGTICLPYDATVEGATILACQGKNTEGQIVFEYAKGTTDAESNELTAGVPYLYRAIADAQTFTMDYSTTYAEASTAGGAFKGSYTEEQLGVGTCILSNGKFYTVALGEGLSTTNVWVGAYRAYVTDWSKLDDIVVVPTARAAVFSLDGGSTTGINGIVDATATAKDGKFVENGKVVIVNNGKKYNVAGQAVK